MTVGQYVTAQGLTIPTVEDLQSKIAADLRGAIDPNFDTDPDSPEGQLIGIVASADREAWEAVQVAYHNNDPDVVENDLLDALSAVTGTSRAAATPSAFTISNPLQLTLNATTTVHAGALVSQAGNATVVFRLTQNVVSTTAGTYTATAECTQLGPVSGNAGTITVIETPFAGWTAVNNLVDAQLGTAENTNLDLRARRVAELANGGTQTVPSVTAGLLAYTTTDNRKPILAVITYENKSDFYDAAGRPPHCIEALVYDGDSPSVANDVIAQIIWDNQGGGIPTFGTTTAEAIDSFGTPQPVAFSRVTSFAIKASVGIVYDGLKGHASTQEVKDAIAKSFAAHRLLGQTTVRWGWFDVWRDVGAIESDNVQLGPNVGALGASYEDLAVPIRRIATLDTTHITVAFHVGVP